MTVLERAIINTVKKGCSRGWKPTSIYLRPDDFRELSRVEVDKLPVRLVKGTGSSRVYFNDSTPLSLPKRRVG